MTSGMLRTPRPINAALGFQFGDIEYVFSNGFFKATFFGTENK
jgi:hypothetical protein